MKRFSHDYDSIISVENLLLAWSVFRRGKSKKLDVQEFERDLMHHILSLHHNLKTKTYHHGPYEHFVISDPKRRDIHKATVRDRLLHHAIYRVLYPYFDTTFIYDSYSCRNGKGTHRALKQCEAYVRTVSKNRTQQCWILKCDIRKFFASIDHRILTCILEKHIVDSEIRWLLSTVIRSFDSGTQGKGLPLGNLTSQLFINVYMNEFDQYVKHTLKEKHYIRYADDFICMSPSKQHLQKARQKCEAFLTERLALTLHPDKVFMKTLSSGVDFLGWMHFPKHRVLRTVTKRRIFKKVELSRGDRATIESYLGMLSHGNCWKLKQKILPILRKTND